jgi:hypothetical protein
MAEDFVIFIDAKNFSNAFDFSYLMLKNLVSLLYAIYKSSAMFQAAAFATHPAGVISYC